MDLRSLPSVSFTSGLSSMTNGYDRLAMFERFNATCGDAGRLALPTNTVLVVNSPDLMHDLLVARVKSFVKSPVLRGALYPLAGEGLFTSEGELWRRQRKTMAPMFHPRELTRYAACMVRCASEAADRWRAGDEIDVLRETVAIAMRAAGLTLFDSDTLDESDELGRALTLALDWANDQVRNPLYLSQVRLRQSALRAFAKLSDATRARWQPAVDKLAFALEHPVQWPTRSTREMKAALAAVERRVERMIADRREDLRVGTSPRSDLLTQLLAARDENGAPMSDRQVRDEVVTLFVAGHETTATSLAWTLHLLGQNPEVRRRAQLEADALETDAPTAADLPRLAYCQQVFKESLRLYPPVYLFGRESVENTRLGDIDVPAFTVVLVSPYALHRRAAYWPDPERFDPDRFTPAAEEARHKHAFIPFSAGPRTCIGNHFALMEGALVLGTLLRRVDFEPVAPEKVHPVPSATLRPGDLRMRVVPRRGATTARA